MSQARVIFEMTLREAARRRILTLAVALGIAMLALFGGAFYILSPQLPAIVLARQQVSKITLLIGLYPVNLLLVMMAVMTSADALAGEIRSGVIQTIAAKPMRRAEIVLGKWCAYALLIAAYIAFLGGGVAAIVYVLGDFDPAHLPAAFALMWLEGVLLLSVTLAASARLSAMASGVVGIGLHGVAFLGGWIEQIGRSVGSAAGERVGVIASVLCPTEALWRRAAYEVQKPILAGIEGGPFRVDVVPSDWMVAYGATYAAVALALAVRWFGRRDL